MPPGSGAEQAPTSGAFDAAVIGAGLLGCAIAYRLAQGGADVVLLERGEVNSQASGQNAGSLHFQMRGHAMSHDGETAARVFERTFPLIMDAQKRWAGLEEELDGDLEVRQHGGVMVAETPEEAALLERKAAHEQALGLDTSLLDGAGSRRTEPALADHVLSASWCPSEGHANPRLIAPAFLRRAIELGARARTHSAVTGLERWGSQWEVRLADGRRVRAAAVVIAAGAWTAELAGLADVRLPVVPIALNMNATEPGPPIVSTLVQHARQRLTLKQVRDGNVLIGGGWPSYLRHEAGVPDKAAPPDPILGAILGNVGVAARVVPPIRGLHMLRCWTGLQGVPPDQLPTLGEVPRRPGLFVANADVVGFSLGPTYAAIVGGAVLGEAPMDGSAQLSPKRFSHLNYI